MRMSGTQTENSGLDVVGATLGDLFPFLSGERVNAPLIGLECHAHTNGIALIGSRVLRS
jgi:hypothetical protein